MLRFQNERMGSPLGEHDLADVAQDTCLVVLRKLDRFEPGTSFESWVFRISQLELMNAVRKSNRLPRAADAQGSSASAMGVAAPGGESAPQFEEIHQGLELLEHNERQVIRLKYFEDLTFEEIAKREQVPLGSVKTRHYRGMSKLLAFMNGRGTEGNDD